MNKTFLFALCMFVAVIAATPSLAKPDLSGSTTATPDLVERWVAVQSPVLRPDDRAGIRGVLIDALADTTGSAQGVAFQWSDAGAGAGLTAAMLMLAGSSFLVVRRALRRRRLLSGMA